MLTCMVIREARAVDWAAISPILKEVGEAGETQTWDPRITEARAHASWMRELPGRTIVAADDDGRITGRANTHPNHSGPGAHVANAGFVVHPARRQEGVGRALSRHVLDQARDDGYRAMQCPWQVTSFPLTSCRWYWNRVSSGFSPRRSVLA